MLIVTLAFDRNIRAIRRLVSLSCTIKIRSGRKIMGSRKGRDKMKAPKQGTSVNGTKCRLGLLKLGINGIDLEIRVIS